jgi:hypothetical protein
MQHFLAGERASKDAYSDLVAGLEIEFGTRNVDAIAARWIEAEAMDFYWQCRLDERALGAYESLEEDGLDLELIAVLGRLHSRWYVAWLVVDGDGAVQDLLQVRQFQAQAEADQAFARGRGNRTG